MTPAKLDKAISVYSLPNCGKCDAAKDKLKRMGYHYEEHSIEYHTTEHDGWREDETVEVMAAHSHMDTIPLIRIGEDFHGYASAMKTLKK